MLILSEDGLANSFVHTKVEWHSQPSLKVKTQKTLIPRRCKLTAEFTIRVRLPPSNLDERTICAPILRETKDISPEET